MKRVLSTLFLFLILLESSIQAIPAKRIVRIITQPDGSSLSTILQGDENFHYFTTSDGIMLQEASDGFMKYATTTPNGMLSVGQYIAHDPEERDEKEKVYITKINKLQINDAIFKTQVRRNVSQSQAVTKDSKFPSRGIIKGLIILAQYKDVKFSANSTTKEFQDMMNAEGYSNNGASGSARDYFIDQSSGVFTPDFDIVGPVTLPQNMSYYGGNDRNKQDQRPAEMTVDACYAADLLGVDFSKYDNDNDGKIDLIYIIYAGYAEAQGGPANSIWPHAWNLGSAGLGIIRIDGKRIYSYACSSELRGNTGTNMDGIGTFCHEFSHCLGLPDIYDTQYSGMVGMGSWSPMDYGSYNNGSRTPAGYSAYERYSVGWLTPTVLENPQKEIKLLPMNTANQAYMLVSDKNPNEYYTIENRQKTGWDTYLPGHGMMIVHIDYVPAIWNRNIVNSSAAGHPHLQIVPADNEFKNFSGDTFPGTIQNTAFTDESQPNAFLYTGGFMGKPISEIKEKDGIITFDFMYISTPIATEATEVTEDQFTANWKRVNDATSYSLKVASCMTGKECILEDFTQFAKGSLVEADKENIADNLNVYTAATNWTGQKIYQAGGYCKIGDRTSGGSLTTPLLDLSKEKEFTLSFHIEGSENWLNGYDFALIDEKGEVLQSQTAMMSTAAKKIYWVFSTEKAAGTVRIQTKASASLDYIHIYNGNVIEQLQKGETLSIPEEYVNEINDITDNSYTVTGLENDKRYIYSLYAKQDEKISPMSNKIILKTQKPSAIETIYSFEREIYTDRGILHFSTATKESIHIYTASGVNIYSGYSQMGKNDIPLPTGLYILTIGMEKFKIHIP